MNRNKITLRAFSFGAVFAAVFAALTVYIENRYDIIITSTQIPVLPYILIIILALLLNPVGRLIRIARPFSSVEIMVIFMMGMVSAGLSTFGLTSQLVPIAGSLFNADWNNSQLEWNRYVVPYLNERYFVSEPGIQAAAVEYRQKLTALLEKKKALETAGAVADHAGLLAAQEAELARSPEKDARAAALENTRRLQADALRQWQDLRRRQRNLPEWPETLQALPAEIKRRELEVAAAEKKLLALEEKAFAKVAVFRRGLPAQERAYPGILPMSTDDRRAYFGRLRRLIGGLGALNQLKSAWQSARSLPAGELIAPAAAAPYAASLARAAGALAKLDNSVELAGLKERLDAEDKKYSAERIELAARLKAASLEKSKAGRERSSALAGQVNAIIAEMQRLDRRYQNFKKSQELCFHEVACARNIQTLLGRINALRESLSAAELRAGGLAAKISELLPAFASLDISLRRYFLGQVPWHCWLKPLARWALAIGLTYIVLMALNVLIFRQWAHNERLTYPLVELSEALIGAPDSTGLPAVFRNGFFWAGLAISMSVLGWNLLCSTQLVPGLAPFNLQNYWYAYLAKTQFAGLCTMRAEIFFTMIGLSFLVPKNISFSLWFFYVIYLAQLLAMVWAGYGQDSRSFPFDWWYVTNFHTAQGQGALLIFSGFVLYKCRKYILCALFPASVADLETAERNELKLASLAFLACSFGLILLLWLSMGANLYYTILFYIVILVTTIGLVRVVAEGGILSFQAKVNMVHFLRNVFGLNRPWTSAALFAPLMVYHAIIFLDIKTFIAPAMANALKLREDFRLKRFAFHVAVAAAIGVAALVAIVTALMMCYDRGADAMQQWFYVSLPKDSMFEVIKAVIKDGPDAATGNIAWTIGGGALMAALLFFRQYYFWMPHPIGLIMAISPLMDAYWFSIFLGWICNVAVTKYGNQDAFRRAKGFFIGLIVGELILVLVAFLVTATMGTSSGIDLNRGGA